MTTNATPRPYTPMEFERDGEAMGDWSIDRIRATVEYLDVTLARLASARYTQEAQQDDMTELRKSHAASEARAKRLGEALGAIVTRYDTTHVSAMELVSIARAALAAKEGT